MGAAASSLLGAALTYIMVTSVTIWLARWNTKSRPRLAWQRLWTAVVWSQPAALGVSALISLCISDVDVAITYLIVTGLALASAGFIRDHALLSRVLCSFVTITLLSLLVAYGLGSGITDPL